MIFYIQKIDKNGKNIHLIDSFENIADAIEFIENEGSIPVKITNLNFLNFLSPIFNPKIKTENIIEILENILLIIKSGIPIQEGLSDLMKETKDYKVKKILKYIVSDINSGFSLSKTFEKFKHQFGNIVVYLIQIGETTGNLEYTLNQAINFLQNVESIKKKVKQAMIYPAFAFIAIFAAMLVWILYVMPKLITLFKQMNVELPLITQIVMNTSEFMQKYFLYIFIGIFLIIAGIILLIKKNEKVKFYFDKILLKIPIINKFIKYFNSALLSEYIKLSLSSGISLIDGLDILKKNLSNLVYKNSIENIIESIKKGNNLSDSIKESKIYPLFVVRMIKVGEDTGELEKQLNTISNYYYEKIDYLANNISKFIEPIIIIVLGVFMAIIVLSLFGPIYSLIGKIS